MDGPDGGTTHDIVTTRVLDAPRERVHAAFADADAVARWWGPAGFTNVVHELDVRPGGAFRVTMRAPDGSTFDLAYVFVETAPDRIVIRNPQPGHAFDSTFALEADGDRTRLTWTMRFDSAEEAARVRSFVAQANEQGLDRLQAHLSRATG